MAKGRTKGRALKKRGYVRREADGAMMVVGEAKKRAANRRGAGGLAFIVRDNRTGGYIKVGEDGAVTMTGEALEATEYATDAEARTAAMRYITNNYSIEPQ